MPKNSLPSVSIVIPTLNSEKTLEECLDSIATQGYPQELVEIIIADGGSSDRTLEIARKYTNNIYHNELKTGEAGKAVGAKQASNEIIAFIDSDNILPSNNWLRRMVEPFQDQEIVGTETIKYTYRPKDSYITRYCALLGMNDPLCLFLGNYDRYSTLTGKWTEMFHKEEDKGGYLKIELEKDHLPTIGADGFLIRRSALEKCNIGDYLFDIDVIYELLNPTNSINPKNPINSKNAINSTNPTNSINPIRFAKVKTGIVHIFFGNISTFARKQRRRITDYFYYSKLGVRKYPWKNASKTKLIKFILSCITIIPLLIQSLKDYTKRPDRTWLFHPIACWNNTLGI